MLLKSKDIKPLLAILFVLDGRKDYELSEQQGIDFIVQKWLAIDNYLIREILSDPSGQIPDDAVDEDSGNCKVSLPDGADVVGVGVEALFNK